MQEPDRTLQSGRRYVLGETQDFYGIWDEESPGKPVESFALTDEGLQDATRRFAQLSQKDFWARFGPTALRRALFAGLGVWIFTGLVLWIGYSSFSPYAELRGPVPLRTYASPIYEPTWLRVASVIENMAFRVWIAALAIIFALRLLDRGRQPI